MGVADQKFYKLYILGKKKISLHIEKSDFSRNSIVLKHLTATLVRESLSGQMIPYLAAKIETNEEKTLWKFKIREGVSCENGEKVTAKSFSKNLLTSLKRYKKKSDLLDFEKLLGADRLTDSKVQSIPGIRYVGDVLILEFKSNPEDLLYRLEQPFFGYLCKENFSKNGKWKHERKIISSGSYRLLESDGGPLTLIYREGSKLSPSVGIKRVKVIVTDDVSKIDVSKSIVRVSSYVPDIPQMTFVKGLPTFTTSVSLPVHENGFFNDVKKRRRFMKLLYLEKNKVNEEIKGSSHTSSLFIVEKADRMKANIFSQDNKIKRNSKSKVTLAIRLSSNGKAYDYIKRLIYAVAEKMSIDVELATSENSHKKAEKFGVWGNKYDIRVSSVDLGAEPRFALLDMVFCSSMGVSYQPYLPSICSFIEKENKKNKGEPLTSDQLDKLYRMIASEAFLMPILHRSISYFYSSEFDLNYVSKSSIGIRFEDLKLANE